MLAFTRSLIRSSLPSHVLVHTSALATAAEKSPLFLLRQRTGLAYSLCREALNKHENNIEEAEAWLKAHAMAHGLQKASKVRDRSAREGLVCLSVPRDNSLTTVVELNCETDFVAKNQLFRDFALSITEQVSSNQNDSTSHKLPEQDIITVRKPSDEVIKDIESQIVPLISKLGENIKLSRVMHLQPAAEEKSMKLFGQIHAQAAKKETDQFELMAGRFGAIVALRLTQEAQSKNHGTIRLFGNRLCQHVIGYNPSYIELPPKVRKNLEEIERERRENQSSETGAAANEDLSDHEGDDIPTNSKDEWPSIMDQTLIMSDDLVVRQFCEMNGISIVYFNRLECGMESW